MIPCEISQPGAEADLWKLYVGIALRARARNKPWEEVID
jgi:hypothetical protein